MNEFFADLNHMTLLYLIFLTSLQTSETTVRKPKRTGRKKRNERSDKILCHIFPTQGVVASFAINFASTNKCLIVTSENW